MRTHHLLPELMFGWKTPAPKVKNKPGCRTSKRRRIPQDAIREMRKEWEALPLDSNGHKPTGCYQRLAEKYKLSRAYAYNLLNLGLRDDERETTLSKGTVMTQHPAAKAAKELAASKAETQEVFRQKGIALTKDLGLRYLHIRARSTDNQPLSYGGCTLAYTFAGPDRVNVAVATCHKKDSYSKNAGRIQAALNYDTGRYITLRITKGLTPVQFLQASFAWAGQPAF